MLDSFADPAEFPELPIGRLGLLTLQRVATATEIHHRCGPWARYSEDDSQVVLVGVGLTEPA